MYPNLLLNDEDHQSDFLCTYYLMKTAQNRCLTDKTEHGHLNPSNSGVNMNAQVLKSSKKYMDAVERKMH